MNAIIYTRVSTEDQGNKGYSLQSQLEKCREYAELHGYTNVAEFEDRASGENLDREGLNNALHFCSQNPVQILIVFDIDRFSRSLQHHAILELQFEGRGVKIEYVLGDFNDGSSESRMIKGFKQLISENENRQRRERTIRGIRTKVGLGKVIVGSRPPYGYTHVDGNLVIDPVESEIVKRMYSLLNGGLSTTDVAKILHQEGIPTRGDHNAGVYKRSEFTVWHPTTVKRIIKNETYTGIWHYGKTKVIKVNGKRKQIPCPQSEWVKVSIPQIIDVETFKYAQKRLDENFRKAKRNTKRDYLLQGLIYCACGRSCACKYCKTNLYYQCPVRRRHEWQLPCPTGFYASASSLEAIVWDTIVNLLLDPECLKIEVERQRKQAEEQSEGTRNRLEAVESAITDTKRKIGILLDQILDGDFPKAIIEEKKAQLTKTLRSLEAEKSQLELSISELTITPIQEKALTRLAEEIKTGIETISFEDKRKILQVLKIRIDVLDRKKVRLSGILPLEREIEAPSPRRRVAQLAKWRWPGA